MLQTIIFYLCVIVQTASAIVGVIGLLKAGKKSINLHIFGLALGFVGLGLLLPAGLLQALNGLNDLDWQREQNIAESNFWIRYGLITAIIGILINVFAYKDLKAQREEDKRNES